MTHGGVPPGWYNDTTAPGGLRYWDGQRWTDYRQPPPPRPAPYPIGTPPGHLAPAWVGYAGPPPRSPQRRTTRIIVAVAAVAVLGAFALYLLSSGGGTHSKWYQEGYDIGNAQRKSVVYPTAESACGMLLLGKVRIGDTNYTKHKREMESGCLQGFRDRNDQ